MTARRRRWVDKPALQNYQQIKWSFSLHFTVVLSRAHVGREKNAKSPKLTIGSGRRCQLARGQHAASGQIPAWFFREDARVRRRRKARKSWSKGRTLLHRKPRQVSQSSHSASLRTSLFGALYPSLGQGGFPSPNSALAFYFFSFILLLVRYSYWLISRLGRKEKKNILFFSSLISLACRHRTCQSSKSMSDFLGTQFQK